MADVNFDHIETGYAARGDTGSGSFWVNLAGAATSVALVLGLGFWGYKLAMRDMTGIPVVRALEGPMRIAPQDPGGEVADYIGLSVNSVAAEGAASGPADRLVLAPAPVDLAAEDAAGTTVATLVPVSGRSDMMPGLGLTPLAPEAENPALMAVSANSGDSDVMRALAEALADGSTPLSGDAGAMTEVAASYNLPKGAMAQSPRPMPRPGVVRVAVAPSTTEVDGNALTTGTRLVQLGAFDSAEIARKEWDRIAAKFGDLLVGKSRIVQAAQSSGRTFYRLRAEGFADEADARRFCSALVAEQAACIPVTVR